MNSVPWQKPLFSETVHWILRTSLEAYRAGFNIFSFRGAKKKEVTCPGSHSCLSIEQTLLQVLWVPHAGHFNKYCPGKYYSGKMGSQSKLVVLHQESNSPFSSNICIRKFACAKILGSICHGRSPRKDQKKFFFPMNTKESIRQGSSNIFWSVIFYP